MTEQTENLVLEYLLTMRADIASIKDRLDDLTARVTSLETHVAAVVADVLRINGRLDRIETRLDRIEHGLELVSWCGQTRTSRRVLRSS